MATKYSIIRPDVSQLAHLDETEAIVVEGLEEDSIQAFVNWASDIAGTSVDVVEVYVMKGELLNRAWTLTGTNRYPDDLTIVAVSFDQLYHPGSLAIPRFNVGARWWSDVMENNLRREGVKNINEKR